MLLLVQVCIPNGWGCRRGTTGVTQLLSFAHVLMQVMLHKKPSALVLWFILTPHNVDHIGLGFEFRHKDFVWERVQLLYAQNNHVFGAQFVAFLDQVVIDFP